MKILATDLDRTLLPNGSWEADENAINLFNKLTEKDDILVVYVTGRNLTLTENAINEFGVRHPNILCGDVGTTIRRYENDKWEFDSGWVNHVKNESPKWDALAIKEAITGIDGIREQEPEHQNQFKQSYYVEHEKKDNILNEINNRVKGKFDEVIVYSFDSQDGKGLIDFLPNSATKQTAIEYVAKEYGVPKEEVVFCGDSGNDIFPLTAGFRGVLVKNADDQLIEKVKNAMKENPELKAYFAKGNFKGLNGYYASGVIEGAYHYRVFDNSSNNSEL
jgi:hypothetical protein